MQQGIIEGFGLSPQQKRLWLLQQTDQSPAYRAQCAVLIEGKLQPEILKEALERVVNKHEILRTGFRCLPGMTIPVQFISAHNASWRTLDLSSLDDKTQLAEIDELFEVEGRVAFDFDEGSITRTSLIVLSPDKHVLLVTLPALCADAWMLNNLIGEIARFYAACKQGEELFEEPMQYADFFSWTEELLEADGAETGKEFWRTCDLSALGGLRVPFEIQPFGNPTFEPKLISIPIGSEILAKVEAFVSEHGGSASIFLQACWQVLLWRLTGQAEMIIGTAYDGRKYEELEEALGLYARFLPVECHLEESLQFNELFKRIRETASDAYKWQEYFSWDLARGLTAENRKELFFPFCFEFEQQPAKHSAANVSLSIYKQYTCFDRYKIKLSCISWDSALTADFHYDPALFQAEDIHHLAVNFLTLVESAIANPEVAISELNILSDSERQQVLFDFNDTKADYPKDKCIHELIEEQAVRTPEAIAVICEDEQLTYLELNTRANQLARYLKTLGVGPEQLVGICLERSLRMVVGILGILKAGAAYVPLDPTYPGERLAFMLEDSQVSVLLTQHQLIQRLPYHEAQIVSLDTDWPLISQQGKENPGSTALAENLAYVIYTSGSTGKPKGVMITHANLCHYVQAMAPVLSITAGVSYLHTASIAFSSSVRQLMAPLSHGAAIVVATAEQIRDPLELFAVIKRNGVTTIDIVPSYWRNCNHALASLDAKSRSVLLDNNLRLIVSASEPLLSDVPSQWTFEFKHGARLINMFGQTETAGIVTTYPIPVKENERAEVVLIGRPIANTQIYVLDKHLNPVPRGVIGELCIGGDGLARGYLNRAELTAERFVPNPYSDESGARLYKTGDLARFLPDGNIEFLGRSDHQVKIRGFRVELGEIEAVLADHGGVRKAVVSVREDRTGENRLIAFLVLDKNESPTINELRSFIKEKLPEYMIPSAFVVLDTMPLTPNGKIDRLSLPIPDQVLHGLENAFVAPRTQVEELLAMIWAQVLGLEQVGVHDNFFELGGDSILAIQILVKTNQAGLRLTPQQLFQFPTVAELAAVAGTAPTVEAQQEVVSGEVFLSPIQHYFFEQAPPDPHHFNQAILLEAQQSLNPNLLAQVVTQLATHHDALRLRFIQRESGWHQFNASTEGTAIFSHVDLSALPEEEQAPNVEKTAAELLTSLDLTEGHFREDSGLGQMSVMEAQAAEVQASLNLSDGPLMRVVLFDFGVKRHSQLLLVIHHLVVDGISWRILLEDLQTGYQQLSRGEAIKLHDKTTSFQQWAKRLTEHAQAAALKELSYWMDQSRARVSRIPVDYPAGVNTRISTRKVTVSFTTEETGVILRELPAAFHTQINDVLLTVLAQAFVRWTGESSLLIDLEGHGREEIVEGVDLSRTVGWFTAIFPVLLDLGGASNPAKALQAVKEQLRNIPNRGIGYGLLRYLSHDEGAQKLRALPQAEVRFNYLGQFDQILQNSSLFKLSGESSGPARSLRGSRRYPLDVIALITGGQLQLLWTYSENIHRRTTVERLAQGFIEAMRSLIAHCQSTEAEAYIPSDFPLANFDQGQLDKIISRLRTK